MHQSKNSIKMILLYLLVIILVVSNLGIITNNTVRKSVLYLLFVGFVVYYMIRNSFRLRVQYGVLLFSTIIILFYLLLIKQFSISADRVIYILMDVGMIWIGEGIALKEGNEVVKKLLKCHVYACSFASVYYLLFFDISSIYGYGLKHSLAANILISFIVLILKKIELTKLVYIITLLLQGYTILNLNSRSTALGLVFCLICVLFINRKAILAILKNKRKFILVVGGVIAFICVLPNAIASFSKVMRIDALKSIGLSDYSADRIPMIQEGFEYVRGHELFGIANKGIASSNFYIECFPIDIYVQLGCVGLLLYLLWFGIITKKLFKKSRFKDGSDLAKVIYMTILVVSLFSANAPMGPGTAYSLAWLVIGMYWNHSLSMEEK